MASEPRTRYGHSAKDIAQDFAEQLKYTFDADVYHTTEEEERHRERKARKESIIFPLNSSWDVQ